MHAVSAGLNLVNLKHPAKTLYLNVNHYLTFDGVVMALT